MVNIVLPYIIQREKIRGKVIKSSFDKDIRVEELVKFFTEEFEKEKLSIDDLQKGNKYSNAINIYLR